MRKKKRREERLANMSRLLLDKGTDCVPNSNQALCLEIGCGKGKFICENALRYPENLYIAVEKMTDVIIAALEYTAGTDLRNVKFINDDALVLPDYIAPGTVSEIYLNFSDPWRKTRNMKRRLTHPAFLDLYKNLLTQSGNVQLKTDNSEFFEWSVRQFVNCGFTIAEMTRDLHNSEYAASNIMTEYESYFISQGKTINYVKVRR